MTMVNVCRATLLPSHLFVVARSFRRPFAMTTPLSREELRAKRLHALLGEEPVTVAPTRVAETNAPMESPPSDLPSVASFTAAESEEVQDVSLSARSSRCRDNYQAVIDLCSSGSDTDDDEESVVVTIPSPKRTKKAAAIAKPKKAPSSLAPAAAPSSRIVVPPETAIQPSKSGGTRPVRPAEFQVATWNVWFGPHNGANPHVRARMAEMARILRDCSHPQIQLQQQPPIGSTPPTPPPPPLWFVGFQEVTEESRVVLEKHLPEYKFVRQPGNIAYYCMLGVRQANTEKDPVLLDSGCVDYHTTACARAFCYARVRLPASSEQVLVATTHLESWWGKDYTGHDERRTQLLQFETFARSQMGRHPYLRSCILMGDYNWDDESRSARLDDKTQKVLSLPSADVWLQYQSQDSSRSKQTCFTYDAPRNPMLGSKMRRRFDRCVAMSREASHLPRATRVELLGTEELPGMRWSKVNSFTGTSREVPTMISDHYGLLASLSFE